MMIFVAEVLEVFVGGVGVGVGGVVVVVVVCNLSSCSEKSHHWWVPCLVPRPAALGFSSTTPSKKFNKRFRKYKEDVRPR